MSTFTQLLLSNAGNASEAEWVASSSSMVLTCVAGSVLVTDETDGAGITLWAGTTAEPNKILDFWQGARLKVTAQSSGTTFRVSKHSYQDL